jgi:hypothetical protein
MICVFMKGTTKQVISSSSSADWIKPGDADWPVTVYKTEAAFLKKWKGLEKAGYTLVKTLSIAPKRKATKYVVKVKGSSDARLSAFGAWLKAQPYGAVGYFELVAQKLPKGLTQDDALAREARGFISLPDGSLVVANASGKILLLDSEGGKARTLADSLETFLTKLAKGRTGVDELDDKAATGRKALTDWLARR